ncbi:hypothetical protein PBDP_4027 [Pseudomonas sp. St290]|nr:hypothetical protein PBDP_4027 [Pseudomonas sp. St290]
MLISPQLQQLDPQQRTALQIEQSSGFGFDQAAQGLFIDTGVHRFHRQGQRRRCIDHLQGTLIVEHEAGPQALVTRHQCIEALLQRGTVESTAQTQRGGNVIGAAGGFQLPEEPLPLLGERERQRLVARNTGDARLIIRRRRAQGLDKRSQAVVGEQQAKRHLDIQLLANPRHHLGGQQGMAAQFEEVVIQAHPLDLEDIGPDRRHRLLHGGLRRDIGFLPLTGIGLGQLLAIQLAVGRQREARQQHHVGRHHVVGQVDLEPCGEAVTQVALGGGVQVIQFGGWDDVRHQRLAARRVLGQHRRFAHAALFQQARLDFPQFDAEPADLHLVVDAPEVFEDAVGTLARQVTGAIQALAGDKRMGHETFGGQRRTLEITPGQALAADQQFTGHAIGHRHQVGTDDVQRGVVDGAAQPRLRSLGLQRVQGRPDGGFRRAVEVPHFTAKGEHAHGQFPGQRLATAQALAAAQTLGVLVVQQHAPGRRRGLDHVDLLRRDQRQHRVRVLGDVLAGQHDARADHQRHVDFQAENIERERGQRQRPVLGRHARRLGHARDEIGQRAVAHHHALGLAGGAGGVDRVGQVLRIQARRRRLAGIAVEPVTLLVQHQRGDANTGPCGSEPVGAKLARDSIGTPTITID